jgi:hypothetical protein
METYDYYLSNNVIIQLQNYGLNNDEIDANPSIDEEIENLYYEKDFHLGNKKKILALEKVFYNKKNQ